MSPIQLIKSFGLPAWYSVAELRVEGLLKLGVSLALCVSKHGLLRVALLHLQNAGSLDASFVCPSGLDHGNVTDTVLFQLIWRALEISRDTPRSQFKVAVKPRRSHGLHPDRAVSQVLVSLPNLRFSAHRVLCGVGIHQARLWLVTLFVELGAKAYVLGHLDVPSSLITH